MKKILLFLSLAVVCLFNACSDDDEPVVTPPTFINVDEITAGGQEEVTLSVQDYKEEYELMIDGEVVEVSDATKTTVKTWAVKFKVPFQAKSGNIQVRTNDGTIIQGPKFNYRSRYFTAYTGGFGNAFGFSMAAYENGALTWNTWTKSLSRTEARGIEKIDGRLNLVMNYNKQAMTLPGTWVLNPDKLTGIAVTDDGAVMFFVDLGDVNYSENRILYTTVRSDAAGYFTDLSADQFGICIDMETDHDGNNFFFVEEGKPYIKRILNYQNLDILAGSDVAGHVDGQGAEARFENVAAITIDRTNSLLYVADNNCIREVTFDGKVTTLAGSTTSGDKDGNLTEARFNNIKGIALASDGTLYIVDSNNKKIKTINADRTTVTTLHKASISTNEKTATVPIVVDDNGLIYVLTEGGQNGMFVYLPESYISTGSVFTELYDQTHASVLGIHLEEGE